MDKGPAEDERRQAADAAAAAVNNSLFFKSICLVQNLERSFVRRHQVTQVTHQAHLNQLRGLSNINAAIGLLRRVRHTTASHMVWNVHFIYVFGFVLKFVLFARAAHPYLSGELA